MWSGLRIRPLALLALAALAACGGGTTVSERTPEGLSLRVGFSPEPLQAEAPVTWSLEVRNNTADPVTLVFSSAKRGDVVLLRDGNEIYRWSAERVFPQVIRSEPLGPGERTVYRLEEPRLAVDPGPYELAASLAAEPAPSPVRRGVTVEEG